jgi:hypothetical protein
MNSFPTHNWKLKSDQAVTARILSQVSCGTDEGFCDACHIWLLNRPSSWPIRHASSRNMWPVLSRPCFPRTRSRTRHSSATVLTSQGCRQRGMYEFKIFEPRTVRVQLAKEICRVLWGMEELTKTYSSMYLSETICACFEFPEPCSFFIECCHDGIFGKGFGSIFDRWASRLLVVSVRTKSQNKTLSWSGAGSLRTYTSAGQQSIDQKFGAEISSSTCHIIAI